MIKYLLFALGLANLILYATDINYDNFWSPYRLVVGVVVIALSAPEIVWNIKRWQKRA